MCCYALWYCQRIFCNAPDLDLQCWWKSKKININILIAKGGAWAPSAPPGCAFDCIEIFFIFQNFWSTWACPENRVCPEFFKLGGRLPPPPRLPLVIFVAHQRGIFAILPWNEAYISIRCDTASWCARNSCEKRYSLFLLSVSDYQRLDKACISQSLTSTRSLVKPQVKVSHEPGADLANKVRGGVFSKIW